MGQKIIPTSLRLNKYQNQNSLWFVEKKNYPEYLHFDLSIKKYITSLLGGGCQISIKKNLNTDLIYIYFLKENNNNILKQNVQDNLNSMFLDKNIKVVFIKLSIFFLKKRKQFSKILQALKKKNQFVQDLNILKMIFLTKNISLLSTLIAKGVEKTPKHQRYIKSLNNTLNFFFQNYSGLKGYKVQFKGRLNGKERSQKKVIQGGCIPLNTLKYEIKYDFTKALTPYGICGIKVWLFINNNVISK